MYLKYAIKIYKKLIPLNSFKFAYITAVHKKCRHDKVNYKPINILPILSKIFEQYLYDQIYKNVDSILLKYQTGIRKGHQCLKNGGRGKRGALIIDLSKAFESLQHDLLLAKLNVYRFCYKSNNIVSFFFIRKKV